jgi:hypothetical protein
MFTSLQVEDNYVRKQKLTSKTPPNKKPVRPADGFLKTAKTRVPSLNIGSEKDLE